MKMKDKIEFSQSDMIDMLVDKINFLTEEYKKLHSSFEFDDNKGRTKVDPIRVTESYQRFLGESGDIKRLLKFYEMFKSEEKKTIDKPGMIKS